MHVFDRPIHYEVLSESRLVCRDGCWKNSFVCGVSSWSVSSFHGLTAVGFCRSRHSRSNRKNAVSCVHSGVGKNAGHGGRYLYASCDGTCALPRGVNSRCFLGDADWSDVGMGETLGSSRSRHRVAMILRLILSSIVKRQAFDHDSACQSTWQLLDYRYLRERMTTGGWHTNRYSSISVRKMICKCELSDTLTVRPPTW